MGRFFSNIFASAIGLIIGIGLLGLILISVGNSISGIAEVDVKEKSVLTFNLKGSLKEMASPNPLNKLPAPIGNDGQKDWSLLELLPAIDDAINDSRIEGMLIKTKGIAAGFASMAEVRMRLKKFKDAGKFIYVYGENISEGEYYLASVADSIFLHPWGNVEMNGIGGELTFYKGMFDKVGVKPEIFRVGDFKSAVEPYYRTGMSEESRYQMKVYMDALYDYYLKDVSEGRNLSVDSLNNITTNMLARTAEITKDLGLVDRIVYEDEVTDAIQSKLNLDEDDKPEFLSLGKYIQAEKSWKEEKETSNKIAVIVGDGPIMTGNGEAGEIGGDWYAAQIRKARKSKSVKAIVLRINSPGGSALASDIIWREVMRTKGEKPIFASMSDVAASGGYYMAMGCDTIVAQPNTITGSIGIFSVLFEAEELLQEKMGLSFEEVTTHPLANIGSPSSKFTEKEREVLQDGVNEGYEIFTGKAAKGRGLAVDSLKKLASGRVWIGTDAHERGLVDVLGTFDDAMALAAKSAGLEEGDYEPLYYAKKADGLAGIFQQVKMQEVEAQRKEVFGEFYPFYQEFTQLKKLQGEPIMLLQEKMTW